MESPDSLGKALDFLRRLEESGTWYRLSSGRDALMVEVFIPGQRWEVEFFADGSVEVERFVGAGVVDGATLLDALIAEATEEDYPNETPDERARRRASYYRQL